MMTDKEVIVVAEEATEVEEAVIVVVEVTEVVIHKDPQFTKEHKVDHKFNSSPTTLNLA